MDIFSMLQNATIFDTDGEARAQSVGFECINGRMRLTAIFFDDQLEEEDDPIKDDIPEETIQKKIHAISEYVLCGGRDGR